MGTQQTILRVISGGTTSGTAIYGQLVPHRSEIIGIMDRWDAAEASATTADDDISTNAFCTHSGARLTYAELNGDGLPDAMCHDSAGYRWAAYNHDRLIATTYSHSGPFCNHSGASFYVGDANGDGVDDSICHDTAGHRFVDLSATSGNPFGSTNWADTTTAWCNFANSELLVGDANGDGITDLICHATDTGWLFVDFGTSTGAYAGTDWSGSSTYTFCSGSNKRLLAGDVDGDGDADLICHDRSTGDVSVSHASSAAPYYPGATFSSALGFCAASGTVASVGDYNGDEMTDLLCTTTATGGTWLSLYAVSPTNGISAPFPYVNSDTFSGYRFGWGPVRVRRVSAALPWGR